MHIITTTSLWFFPLCLIAGFIYASLLYYKNKNEDFTKTLNTLLFIIRFITITLICFFLLSPLIKTISRDTEKPLIIIAQDNSESILINKDSLFYKNIYPKLIDDLTQKLSKNFDVKIYTFGEEVADNNNFDFQEKFTHISSVFKFLNSTYYNSPLSAIILASDGIYNAGTNPLHEAVGLQYKVFSLALGDTNISKDLIVEKINHNNIVFLNNNFPVEINVSAFKCKGEKSQMEIFYDNKKISTQTIDINHENFIKTFTFSINADKPGKKKLTAVLSKIDGEISTNNNSMSVYVDVIDSRQKILMLSAAPHPDIGAFRKAIESNINYDFVHYQENDFKGQLSSYSLVILHNLPAAANTNQGTYKQLSESDIPVLYITGTKTNISAFNSLNSGLIINNIRANNFNEVLPLYNREFSLFTLSEHTQKTLLRLPPLTSYFGNYNIRLSGQVLLFQKIGNVNTKSPLIFLNEVSEKKTGIITGEGYWKWQLFDYLENENHTASFEIINKIIQYLAVKADKSNFRIYAKDFYFENEPIVIDAELYNESYEAINTPEVGLIIKNEKNNSYPFTFSRNSNAYTLNAGSFPEGEYTYEAKTKVGNNILIKNGSFIIASLNKEATLTKADHKMLNNLAVKHGGKMYYPSETEKLYNDLINNDEFKPIIYERTSMSELISMTVLLFLIIALLSIEWYIRKRSGSY